MIVSAHRSPALPAPPGNQREQSVKWEVSPRSAGQLAQWVAEKARQYHHVNWALFDQALVSGVNFLTAIVLARFLGLAEFGQFTLGWIAVELAMMIQQSMIISPLLSLGPSYSEAEQPGYYGALLIQMLGFLAISAVIFIAGFLIIDVSPLDWPVDGLMLPVTAAAVTCQLQNYLRRYLFVNGRPSAAFVNDIFRYGIQLAFVFILVPQLGLKTPGCYWIITGCATLATVHGFLTIRNIRWDARVFRDSLGRNWHFSKWLVTSEMLRWATVQLYITVAGIYLGAAAVGTLRAAQNILGVCNIFMLAIENFAPARAAIYYRDSGLAGLRRYLNNLLIFGLPIVGGVALVASVAPEFWFTLIYGTGHGGQGYIVQCWALFFCINYLNYPVGIGLRTIEKTAAIFKVFAITAAISIVTVVPLTKYVGIPGVLVGVIGMVAIRYVLLAAGFRSAGRELAAAGRTPSI